MALSEINEIEHLNVAKLRAAERRETLTIFALSLPALVVVFVIIVIPVGWLFSLSFLDSSGQLSLVNYQKMIEYKSYARVFNCLLYTSPSPRD